MVGDAAGSLAERTEERALIVIPAPDYTIRGQASAGIPCFKSTDVLVNNLSEHYHSSLCSSAISELSDKALSLRELDKSFLSR